jgi:hypothetical protein
MCARTIKKFFWHSTSSDGKRHFHSFKQAVLRPEEKMLRRSNEKSVKEVAQRLLHLLHSPSNSPISEIGVARKRNRN